MLIENFDIVRQILYDAFRTQHFLRQCFQEKLLHLYPPNVAIGIPPEPHKLLRFFPVQMLHAFFQVNQRVAGITHIPMHILRHIYIYAAYSVHDFPEALQIDFDIVVNFDTQQILNLQNGIFRAHLFAAVRMYGVQLCNLIIGAALFIQVFAHLITDRHAGITREGNQIDAFLRAVIMCNKNNVRPRSVFIYAEHCHIHFDIAFQKRIQKIHIRSRLNDFLIGKGYIARHLIIGKRRAARQYHKYGNHGAYNLKKRLKWIEFFLPFRHPSATPVFSHSFPVLPLYIVFPVLSVPCRKSFALSVLLFLPDPIRHRSRGRQDKEWYPSSYAPEKYL